MSVRHLVDKNPIKFVSEIKQKLDAAKTSATSFELDEARKNLPVTEGQPGQHKPSPYKYVGKHSSGGHIFDDGTGKKELFAKRKPGTGDSGWHLKRGAHVYEFVSSDLKEAHTDRPYLDQTGETDGHVAMVSPARAFIKNIKSRLDGKKRTVNSHRKDGKPATSTVDEIDYADVANVKTVKAQLDGSHIKRNLKKEEVELDEVSLNTLGNYFQAARKKRKNEILPLKASATGKEYVEANRKEKNTRRGMELALKKIKKKIVEEHELLEGKSRISSEQAKEILGGLSNPTGDYYALGTDDKIHLTDKAKEHKYRKSKNAPGSTSRMFHAHLTRIANRKVNEEVEQLDEISPKKIRKYIDKAQHVDLKEPREKLAKRAKSFDLAVSKLIGKFGSVSNPKVYAREDFVAEDVMNSISKAVSKQAPAKIKFKDGKDHTIPYVDARIIHHKSKKLAGDIKDRFHDALTRNHDSFQKAMAFALRENEETANALLNELSPRKLASYIKRASDDAAQKAMEHGKDVAKAGQNNDPQYPIKNARKASKRLRGVLKATDKLSDKAAENWQLNFESYKYTDQVKKRAKAKFAGKYDVDHEHRIAVDTVKNPLKGVFLGGPSAEEAEKKLRTKYGYSDEKIAKLKGPATPNHDAIYNNIKSRLRRTDD